eukprot:CAMPEP_0182454036 /NCGR_PEP_ID=MMETSP1319-20130603/844_1 /TAXON_ID=172717 /ORGANISM="Bolidomonas pacifica, Strain RCC208" /LENGTH=34 /DNA_ID= /DNA_START= /DNA_END= /DNA_ORIENTATION=
MPPKPPSKAEVGKVVGGDVEVVSEGDGGGVEMTV